MTEPQVFECEGGERYGYFNGKYLVTSSGECSHYRGGTDHRDLYSIVGSRREFYQLGDKIYSVAGSRCRWYTG